MRDLCDLVETYFRDGKWSLLSVGEQIDTRSAAGRMMLSMLTVIGQWEREAIGERTSAAMQHMRSEGKYTGGKAPYGYALSSSGALVPDEREAVIRERVKALRERGLSYRAIVSTLAEQGIVARSGKPFAPSAIAAMVG